MKIQEIIEPLEAFAPLVYQEGYDNAGWITGDPSEQSTGVLLTLDVTEEVVEEAVRNHCNLIISHHPVLFRGLKKITGGHWVERVLIRAIREHIAIYAAHTNLDNMAEGVNRVISDRLGLVNARILAPLAGTLSKLYTFVPSARAEQLRSALFAAGAGQIGAYGECSFNTEGTGTFRGSEDTHPFVGTPGIRHSEGETRVEVVFPRHLEKAVTRALMDNHPYEEPAYDIIQLANPSPNLGAGMIGELPEPIAELDFLERVKRVMEASCVRHTSLLGKPVSQVAVCGGAGSFLLGQARAAGAGVLVTADTRYHEFFEAENQIVIADIGHYESEHFTIELFYRILTEKFRNFAPLKSAIRTNPVNYLI